MSSVSDWPNASNTNGFFVKIWRPMLKSFRHVSDTIRNVCRLASSQSANFVIYCIYLCTYLYWLVSIWTNPISDFLSSRQRTKSIVDKSQTIVTCWLWRRWGERLVFPSRHFLFWASPFPFFIDFVRTCIDFWEDECDVVGKTNLATTNGRHRCRTTLEKSCQRHSM